MKAIFKKINSYIREVISIFARLVLGLVYFVILLPFCIFIRLLTDFLDINDRKPFGWILSDEIGDVGKFLRQQ